MKIKKLLSLSSIFLSAFLVFGCATPDDDNRNNNEPPLEQNEQNQEDRDDNLRDDNFDEPDVEDDQQ